MTGVKGQRWDKPKIIKHKKSVQLTPDDMQFVQKIADKRDWSVSKVIYKIFSAGRKIFKP